MVPSDWSKALVKAIHKKGNKSDRFRKKHSFETQLISAIHDSAKGINVCSQTDVILLDFSKAIESVPHERLLVKLDFYGIRGQMYKWIDTCQIAHRVSQ